MSSNDDGEALRKLGATSESSTAVVVSQPKISKKEAEKMREITSETLRKGLALKKRLVELWEKHTKDVTLRAGITSPDTLLTILEEVGFMHEIVNHIGQRKRWRISDGRSVSTVHLAEGTKAALAKMLFEYMDVDGNHSVSMNELLLVLNAMSDPDPLERSKFHFLMLDADANGKLEGEELRRLVALHQLAMKVAFEVDLIALVQDQGITQEEADEARAAMNGAVFDNEKFVEFGIRELIANADSNKDGMISETEWLAWTTNKTSMARFAAHVEELVLPLLNSPKWQNHAALHTVIRKSIEALEKFF